jgi:hypothetical protein
MDFEIIRATLLSEIQDLQESLQIISRRVKEGIPVGTHANVDAAKINSLIGKYQLLKDAVARNPE